MQGNRYLVRVALIQLQGTLISLYRAQICARLNTLSMCQHAASIVDTAVQKLSAFLSKVLNNTLGDSKLLFPYSPVQFFPLALPHQSQMLKPLFLCQLRAQIIQFKCFCFFFFA